MTSQPANVPHGSATGPAEGTAGAPEGEPWMRTIVEAIPHMVWVAAPDGGNLYNSPSLLQFIGPTDAEVRRDGWSHAIHPDDRAGALEFWARLVRTGEPGDRVHRVLRHDGAYRWVHVVAAPQRDGGGRVARWIGTWTDVHDATLNAAALRESEEMLRLAKDAARMGAWQWDLATGEQTLSERCKALFALPADAPTTAANLLAAIHPEDRSPARAAVEHALQDRGPVTHELRVPLRDGSVRWVELRGRFFYGPDGEPLRVAGMALDITERRRLIDALRESGRRKSDFLAILSHELRNPLAPIRNAVYLLEHTPPGSPQAVRAREVLRRQSDHLAKLVDDLLDLSRIDHDKITLDRGTLDAREVVLRACDDARPAFDDQGLTLRVDAGDAPIWIHADATRVAQIVGNLLGNALKFTPAPGVVEVALRRAGAACELSVRDTGVGIEPEHLERIFEPFAQVDRPATGPGRGGLGVGLTLVRSLAALHGGSARAASAGPGRGAEFTVALPLAAGPGAADGATAAAAAAAAGLSILIVEDSPDAGETLADLLQLMGHRTRLALDGTGGVAAFREWGPDVVISDVGLPDMSGYDVMRRIRALAEGRPVFAVALTGYAQPEDVARAREAGFDAHLAKPPPLEDLTRLLATATARR